MFDFSIFLGITGSIASIAAVSLYKLLIEHKMKGKNDAYVAKEELYNINEAFDKLLIDFSKGQISKEQFHKILAVSEDRLKNIKSDSDILIK